MPAIIDSAPDCVVHKENYNGDDLADFILQGNYSDCAGFGTFMPGSTYGDDGTGAETAYMILTWVGIAVMVAVLVAWVLYENRRLSPEEWETHNDQQRKQPEADRVPAPPDAQEELRVRSACDLDPLCDRGPGDRAVYEHRERVPSNGLSRQLR